MPPCHCCTVRHKLLTTGETDEEGKEALAEISRVLRLMGALQEAFPMDFGDPAEIEEPTPREQCACPARRPSPLCSIARPARHAFFASVRRQPVDGVLGPAKPPAARPPARRRYAQELRESVRDRSGMLLALDALGISVHSFRAWLDSGTLPSEWGLSAGRYAIACPL